jgi:hypothetical protein
MTGVDGHIEIQTLIYTLESVLLFGFKHIDYTMFQALRKNRWKIVPFRYQERFLY